MNGKINDTRNTKKGKTEMFDKKIITIMFFKAYSVICWEAIIPSAR